MSVGVRGRGRWLNGGVKLFFDKGNLPTDQFASLAEHLGRRPRVLGWGASAVGAVVALDDRFCVGTPDGWRDVPWHTVMSGGLAEDGATMHWRLLDGTRGEVHLERTGRFPDAFRDRVEATILLQQQLLFAPGRVLVVSARRDLGRPDAAATWSVHGGPGVRMDDPAVRAFADAELDRLRLEYAF